MALYQLCLFPNLGYSKILHKGEAKSSSVFKTRCCNYVRRPIQCKASTVSNQAIPCRYAEFGPSVWDYDFIQSLTSEFLDNELYTQQRNELNEEVRKMLCKMKNPLYQLELTDDLQRLGLAYHFKNEINGILNNVYTNMDSFMEEKNLYFTALKFRLLRQNGYLISADVFDSFLDGKCDFKEWLSTDIEGILSLYEASFCSMENETILDKARNFSSKHLKEYMEKCKDTDLSLLVGHALEIPLHWRMPRLEARWFIDFYERKQGMNNSLLKLAKLDFNMVQAIHQEDLKHASRWWSKTALKEKSFARDKIVENFVWTVAFSFLPHLGHLRRVLTKVTALITTIDDIYDVYGTLEELELFSDVVSRWDINAVDTLPEYMKICFLELYNFVDEFSRDTLKEKGHQIHSYLAKVWTDLFKAYLIEAKWHFRGYTPYLEEYIDTGWISIGATVILIHVYFSTPNPVRIEDLKYLEEYSNIIRTSSKTFRLVNDLGTQRREIEDGDVIKSIQCYMHETGASEEIAREHIKSMIDTSWKKINEDVNYSSFPQSFTEIALNMLRMSVCMYQYGDAHSIQDTESTKWKSSLLFDAIPIP